MPTSTCLSSLQSTQNAREGQGCSKGINTYQRTKTSTIRNFMFLSLRRGELLSQVEYSNDYPKLNNTQAANTPRFSMENYQTRFFTSN